MPYPPADIRLSGLPTFREKVVSVEQTDSHHCRFGHPGVSPTAEALRQAAPLTVAPVRPKQQLLYLAEVLGFQVTPPPPFCQQMNVHLHLKQTV